MGAAGGGSGVGTPSASPRIAPPVDASTKRPTPAARAASSITAVPPTLTAASKAGSSTARRTSICAARWKTTSGRSVPTTVPIASTSVMLASCSRAPPPTAASRFSRRPVERSSTTLTSSPRSRSASTRFEPMKPAPPVTSARMRPGAYPCRGRERAKSSTRWLPMARCSLISSRERSEGELLARPCAASVRSCAERAGPSAVHRRSSGAWKGIDLFRKGLIGALALAVLLTAATVALAEHIRGTNGPDVLIGTPRADNIDGLGGNDTITGQGGKDKIDGGDGDDHVNGDRACPDEKTTKSSPYYCIPGEDDDDHIDGGKGNDHLNGNGGDDHIHGDDGDDHLRGGKDDDRIKGGDGRDTIEGNSGDDHIFARDGRSDDIDCGLGYDKVVADRSDVLSRCEKVSTPHGNSGGGQHGSPHGNH